MALFSIQQLPSRPEEPRPSPEEDDDAAAAAPATPKRPLSPADAALASVAAKRRRVSAFEFAPAAAGACSVEGPVEMGVADGSAETPVARGAAATATTDVSAESPAGRGGGASAAGCAESPVCRGGAEREERLSAEAHAGSLEPSPLYLNVRRWLTPPPPAALWSSPSTRSPGSLLIDEDCEDVGSRSRSRSRGSREQAASASGPAEPRAAQDEDTRSAYEDAAQRDEGSFSNSSQASRGPWVTQWELRPWVIRAPRTPPSSPPPPPSSPPPPPPSRYVESATGASPLPPPPPPSRYVESASEASPLPPGREVSAASLSARLEALAVATAGANPALSPAVHAAAVQQRSWAPGSLLRGVGTDYLVLGTFGRGVYGQVLHCQEVGTARSRAVKVLRLEGQWSEAAMNEAQALATISLHNPDLHHLVRFYEAFQWGARLFLVMEALDRPLGAFIAQNGQALRMDGIACVLKQLFCALRKLDELDIIHADVKPSNIMITEQPVGRWRAKLVDFSNALSAKRALRAPPAQSVWYRAPEVALGQAFCAAADVWSLGCVAAELATAAPLYRHARCDATLLHAVTRTHGPLPPALLARPGHTRWFYSQDAQGGWALKELSEPDEFKGFTALDDVCLKHYAKLSHREKSRFYVEIVLFGDLLRQMLDVYQERRICPLEALNHDFLTGENFT